MTHPVKDGKKHLESLRDGRRVFIDGKLVDDVTTHPAFRNSVQSSCSLYDFQALPENRELMTFETETGHQVSRAWQKPHVPNLTGTADSYRPAGHDYQGGKRAKATGDYEAWTPGS